MSDNKPKKTVTKWINVLLYSTYTCCRLYDSPEEARKGMEEEDPKYLQITTEPQQIETEDIWS